MTKTRWQDKTKHLKRTQHTQDDNKANRKKSLKLSEMNTLKLSWLPTVPAALPPSEMAESTFKTNVKPILARILRDSVTSVWCQKADDQDSVWIGMDSSSRNGSLTAWSWTWSTNPLSITAWQVWVRVGHLSDWHKIYLYSKVPGPLPPQALEDDLQVPPRHTFWRKGIEMHPMWFKFYLDSPLTQPHQKGTKKAPNWGTWTEKCHAKKMESLIIETCVLWQWCSPYCMDAKCKKKNSRNQSTLHFHYPQMLPNQMENDDSVALRLRVLVLLSL